MSAAATADAAPAKGGKKKLVMIIVAVVLLGAGAGGGWFYSQKKAAAHAEAQGEGHEEAKPAPKKPAVFLPLELFTVNLRNDDIDQFLQVGMNLQLASTDCQKAIQDSLPVIRSRILLLLSSKKGDDLLKREGKVQLAKEVQDEIKEVIGPIGKDIVAVHFSAFVIQ